MYNTSIYLKGRNFGGRNLFLRIRKKVYFDGIYFGGRPNNEICFGRDKFIYLGRGKSFSYGIRQKGNKMANT